LGKGAFGHVNLVKKKTTGELFALKVVNKEHVVKYDKVESVFRERDIL
jgi:serine/threonine protein kinase